MLQVYYIYLHGSLFPKYFDLSHYTAPHFKQALQGSSEARSLRIAYAVLLIQKCILKATL